MDVTFTKPQDIDGWLRLAAEVEPLFGPMVDVPEFRDGLIQAMQENRALGVNADGRLAGGAIIDIAANEILWLVVSAAARGQGIGRFLIGEAIRLLDADRPMLVQTYDSSVEAGAAARILYLEFGFRDIKNAGLNPAGLPTVIMQRPAAGIL